MDLQQFIITTVVVCGAMLLLYILTEPFRRPKKVEDAPPPAPKTFIEEILDASLKGDAPSKQPVNSYAWDDLQRDLHDGAMSFDEIWEKCGGRLPRKPEKREPSSGPIGQDGGSSGEGALGVSGDVKEEPPDGGPHQGIDLRKLEGKCPSKWKEIEPELPIWVSCCACVQTREYGYPRVCRMCGGKGYLIGHEP